MTQHSIKIWDPWVRIFHWSLASTFLLNYFITEEGEFWHNWIGYTAGVLVSLRVVWGFISPGHARFSRFFPTPHRVKHHIAALQSGQLDPYEGHNPMGGAMVLVLMALMLSLAVTGFMMKEIDMFFGEEWLEDLHKVIANLTMAAVVIHVTAVTVIQRKFGIELVRPMITGSRRIHKQE